MNQPDLSFLASNLFETKGVRGLIIEDRASTAVATMLDDIYANLDLIHFRQQRLVIENMYHESANRAEDIFFLFESAGLYIRQNDVCWLSVLTDEKVNLPGLRIATRLMLRQVTPVAIQALRDSSDVTESVAPERVLKTSGGKEYKRPLSAPPPPPSASKSIFQPEKSKPLADTPANTPAKPSKKKPSQGIWG